MNEYPQLLDVDGVPVRKNSMLELHERYIGKGKWETFSDPEWVGNGGTLVTEGEFSKLMDAWDETDQGK